MSKVLATKIFFDLKQNKIKLNQISKAIKIANRGKDDYYKLKDENTNYRHSKN